MKTRSKLAAGFLTLMSVATLAACSGKTSNGTNVVTMKGDTITVSDFYDQVKTSKAAQQSMLTLILSRVLIHSMVIKFQIKKYQKLIIRQLKAMVIHFQAHFHKQV